MDQRSYRSKVVRPSVVSISCSLLLVGLSAAAISSEELRKIEDAVPKKASAQPLQPRKLLVFSRVASRGYRHESIPYGKKALEIMGKETGAFEAVMSDDFSVFEPHNLRQFDAVFFNNGLGEIFLPEQFDELSPKEEEEAMKRDRDVKNSCVEVCR
jgi:hypothetical protein